MRSCNSAPKGGARSLATSATERSDVRDMLTDGGMMWGMGLVGWLVILILVLVIAALVKYVFFK
jgi:hypothetical protein